MPNPFNNAYNNIQLPGVCRFRAASSPPRRLGISWFILLPSPGPSHGTPPGKGGAAPRRRARPADRGGNGAHRVRRARRRLARGARAVFTPTEARFRHFSGGGNGRNKARNSRAPRRGRAEAGAPAQTGGNGAHGCGAGRCPIFIGPAPVGRARAVADFGGGVGHGDGFPAMQQGGTEPSSRAPPRGRAGAAPPGRPPRGERRACCAD